MAQVTSIDAETREAVSSFVDARTAGDALPSEVAGQMNEQPAFGLNPGLSRQSIANATNSVYLIPAQDRVCVALTVGAGANINCPATSDIAAGRSAPATVTLETGGIGIYGVVSDGVESVVVDAGDAAARVAVEGNAYYTVVPAGTALRSVEYVGPSGPVAFPIYDPAAR